MVTDGTCGRRSALPELNETLRKYEMSWSHQKRGLERIQDERVGKQARPCFHGRCQGQALYHTQCEMKRGQKRKRYEREAGKAMPPQVLSKTSTTAADPGRSGSIASPPSLAGLLLDKHGRTTTSLILSKEVCIGFKVLTQFGNIQQWVNTSVVRLQWRTSTTRLRTDCRIRT